MQTDRFVTYANDERKRAFRKANDELAYAQRRIEQAMKAMSALEADGPLLSDDLTRMDFTDVVRDCKAAWQAAEFHATVVGIAGDIA